MALMIPEEEMETCKRLAQPAFEALSLTSGLFSWEKERDWAQEKGQGCVVNAIWVLVTELSVSEDAAKDVCRAEIEASVKKSLLVPNLDLSADLRTYVEAI